MAYNVTYSGDKNFNGQTIVSEDNITVGKLNNFTADIEIIECQYGENTTVIVTVPEGADGNITVDVDGTKYPVVKNETTGKYEAVIPPMPVGNHTVTVAITNSSIYEDKELVKNYTVSKNDHYSLDVNITKGAYGENTTIEVTAPEGISVVNLTIDGQNYTININETTGKGVFNISNLTAGKHEVVVSYPGDGNFEPTSTTELIDIPKAVSEMAVEVAGGEPGENLTVTVNVGPNATGVVAIDINGEKHYVDVDENGTAVYVIENAKPGEYNITAEFKGDDNYAKATSEKYNITVPKFEADIIIEAPVVDENNNVTITIKVEPADATGNITVSLANGTNITVPVENGTAVVNVGVLPVNGTMAYNVTYSGDDNYNGTTIVSDENITVGKLNNFTADIEVIPGQYGENTTVIVTVPEGADGNITVDVDGTKYPVVKNETTGKYEAVIPPMPVGNHTVTVSITNSSIYEDNELTETYNVSANDKYDIKVNVTEGDFGNDTVIEVEVPA